MVQELKNRKFTEFLIWAVPKAEEYLAKQYIIFAFANISLFLPPGVQSSQMCKDTWGDNKLASVKFSQLKQFLLPCILTAKKTKQKKLFVQ